MSKETEKCTLSDDELIAACSKWIDDLCRSGGSKWSLTVPVDFNRDPDMLFTELINRFKLTVQPAQHITYQDTAKGQEHP